MDNEQMKTNGAADAVPTLLRPVAKIIRQMVRMEAFPLLHHPPRLLPRLRMLNLSSMVRRVITTMTNLLLQNVQDAENTFAKIVLIIMAFQVVIMQERLCVMIVVNNWLRPMSLI